MLYDILYEIPIRNSIEKLYFLLEHKSRGANDFELQIVKYKLILHKWQKKELGKLSSIIPILFYQGLDNWDPESELEEVRSLSNPILSLNKNEILIFDLGKIDLLNEFQSPEMKAGMLLLKIIRDPWDDFIDGWNKIREILNSIEASKMVVVRQAHQPSLIVIYLFSRITIGGNYGKAKNNDIVRKSFGRRKRRR